ncbi:MAG TPA: helix-turn-helix domain-containing protein [Povalibacter sp.]|nr:helix-turn-helix domain-containing protein [Povalibacter sp.]
MNRAILEPPPAVAHLVRYFHVEAPQPCVTRLPATPFPLLTVFVSGAALSHSGDEWTDTPAAFIGGPYSRPVCYRALPGTVFIASLLQPGQAARLFGIPQDRLTDSRWPLEELIGRHETERLLGDVRRHAAPGDWAKVIGAWLLARSDSNRMPKLLLPPLSLSGLMRAPRELTQQHGLSLRQLERRFVASYGLPQRSMGRMVRFVHALAAVISGNPAGNLTQLAHDCGYFDQAHMARDFLALAGSPPTQLARAAGADPGWSTFRYERTELDLIMREDARLPPALTER